MVSVINIKTKVPRQFSDSEWEVAKEKGLDKKFKVTEQTKGDVPKKEVVHFSPPELLAKPIVKEAKPENEEVKKGRKKNIAG